jgi:hypothetical protein
LRALLIVAALLALAASVFAGPAGAAGSWTNPFTDVADTAEYRVDVEYVVTKGLFAGTSATAFSPDAPMTRGMIVTVLGRLYDADVNKYTGKGFDDVAAGQYYAAYAEWARESGIVTGIGGNNFRPAGAVTRQELAVIVDNYMEFADIRFPMTLQYTMFADEADIADYAKNAAQTLYNTGIFGGKPGNRFDPKGEATRAEVAGVLRRLMEKVQ